MSAQRVDGDCWQAARVLKVRFTSADMQRWYISDHEYEVMWTEGIGNDENFVVRVDWLPGDRIRALDDSSDSSSSSAIEPVPKQRAKRLCRWREGALRPQ